jgi:hypothetical protein
MCCRRGVFSILIVVWLGKVGRLYVPFLYVQFLIKVERLYRWRENNNQLVNAEDTRTADGFSVPRMRTMVAKLAVWGTR